MFLDSGVGMSHLITEAMLKSILPEVAHRFSEIQSVLDELGLSVDEQLRALQNGHPLEAAIRTGINLEKMMQRMWKEYRPNIEQ